MSARLHHALWALPLLLLIESCEVEPFCLTCVEKDAAAARDAEAGTAGAGGGGADGGVALDGAVNPLDGSFGDGGGDSGLPPGCSPEECNGRDDDCDGLIDDGFDLQTNVHHCGACGSDCAPKSAFGECVSGQCTIMACDVGAYDHNGDVDDGCEYECLKTDTVDDLCNRYDDDCDGTIDDEVDLQSDPTNCGECGATCVLFQAVASCVAGKCAFGGCVAGYVDADANPDTGCEYECVPAVPAIETCNSRDDDCDLLIDENDPGGGVACGETKGECEAGVTHCVQGRVDCVGAIVPTTEICNGLDDDCDDVIDNDNPGAGRVCGIGVGTCIQGREECVAGALVCQNQKDPEPEICDGLDNDCDGTPDDGDPGAGAQCGSDAGECSFGTIHCVNGALVCEGGVTPVAELCNGLDDDCDDVIDDGNPQGGKLCGNGTGQCVKGNEACVGGNLVCMGGQGPIAELCNGLDDDCDGAIDNGNPGGGASCGNDKGECSLGALVCTGGIYVCTGGQGPIDELCDGLDNDCDDQIDEGNPQGGKVCGNGTGQCVKGNEVCSNGNLVCTGGQGPVTELCNGLDDDCDGVIDNGNPGGGTACGNDKGECTQGALVCVGGVYVCTGGQGPIDELCDGLDNDCDDEIDEGNPQAGKLCGNGTGQCVKGSEVCLGGQLVCTGGQGPVAELCNGLDDDCDGVIDNGNPGGGTPCGSDVGECSFGAEVCTGGIYVCVGGVTPVDELCNDLDDDCDGVPDNGNPDGGKICGSSVGTCKVGTQQCVAGQLVCSGDVGPSAELCDGLDNDCDGIVDDGNPQSGAPCGTDVGECELGAEACVGGTLVCQGGVTPTAELCNGLDDDCNGQPDEGDPGSGGLCGTDVGQCSPGTQHCSGGTLVCVGDTGPQPETCNGLDDDCDGTIDDGNPGGGSDCGIATGECAFGVRACVGGAIVCQGGTGPTIELCDGFDNDCDGQDDEDFALATDENNCGACGHVCDLPDATPICLASACEVLACDAGFFDIDLDPANGCEYECNLVGAEVCNGEDDDCDDVIDEDLVVPGNFCNPNGVCQNTVPTCAGAAGWSCDYGSDFEVTETRCDGKDNDCDGQKDEGYGMLDAACSNGTGSCKRTGKYVCNATFDDVECDAPAAGTPADELCDGKDNDCDDLVDERVADDPQTPYRDGVDVTAIPRVLVLRSGNQGFMEIMQYEASRADATSQSRGTISGYACSNADVWPWTNVTWNEANDACCGLNPGGACPAPSDTGKWRLCEAPDWQSACEGPLQSCEWSYSSLCSSSQPLACNGDEHDCNPGLFGDQDCLYTTGSPNFPMCGTSWDAAGVVRDLSGNAKEWTATAQGSAIYEIRGGAYTNLEQGRTCDFDFVVAAETFAHPNTGFRCCFY